MTLKEMEMMFERKEELKENFINSSNKEIDIYLYVESISLDFELKELRYYEILEEENKKLKNILKRKTETFKTEFKEWAKW